jgi:hypothetical protein
MNCFVHCFKEFYVCNPKTGVIDVFLFVSCVPTSMYPHFELILAYVIEAGIA